MVIGEPLRLQPDPHRLDRTHVLGVQFDRAGQFIVRCSNGIDLTWTEWCAWGCAELRRSPYATAHPDKGGSTERMAEVNAARDEGVRDGR